MDNDTKKLLRGIKRFNEEMEALGVSAKKANAATAALREALPPELQDKLEQVMLDYETTGTPAS